MTLAADNVLNGEINPIFFRWVSLAMGEFGLVNEYLSVFPGVYYTLYSWSVSSLAKSLQLILEISATYRLVSYLLVSNWLICRLRAQCMILYQ